MRSSRDMGIRWVFACLGRQDNRGAICDDKAVFELGTDPAVCKAQRPAIIVLGIGLTFGG